MKSLEEKLIDVIDNSKDFKTADVLTDVMLDRRMLLKQNKKMLELLQRFDKEVGDLLAGMGVERRG